MNFKKLKAIVSFSLTLISMTIFLEVE